MKQSELAVKRLTSAFIDELTAAFERICIRSTASCCVWIVANSTFAPSYVETDSLHVSESSQNCPTEFGAAAAISHPVCTVGHIFDPVTTKTDSGPMIDCRITHWSRFVRHQDITEHADPRRDPDNATAMENAVSVERRSL